MYILREVELIVLKSTGGEYSSFYSMDKMLKDDNSVYCAAGSVCMMTLRNPNGCIGEIEVKAPSPVDYTNPVDKMSVWLHQNEGEKDDKPLTVVTRSRDCKSMNLHAKFETPLTANYVTVRLESSVPGNVDIQALILRAPHIGYFPVCSMI